MMSAMKYKILPIPPPPATQARVSRTFRAPPIDGSLTVPEMFDWHLVNTPNHPLFVYSDDHGKEHVILWTHGVRAIHRSARIVMDRVKPKATEIPVVAILAATDSITYFTIMAGIFRAGFTACPISPRNSPAAIAHLFRKANVSHILLGPESTSQDLVASSLALLKGLEESKPKVSVIPTFNEIYRPETEPFEPLQPREFNVEDAVIILHSSGSTNFPKPIIWTHYHLLQVGLMPYFGEVDFTGRRFSGHSIPMYHGMGMMQIAWTAMFGLVISAFEPRSPATLPDPDSVMKSCIDTKSDIILCLPTFVEAWSQKREYVEYLKSIFSIICGGGSLNKSTGDDLWKQGVGIFILYACTEVGIISPILPGQSPADWEYFRLSGTINGKFVPYDSGKSELVIVPKTYGVPCVFNTTLDGIDAYATGDLFIPHPTKPNYWKVFGRVDDQIMHSTGEKTNPGPLENILNQDPYVLSSVIFGRGRSSPGIIFDPNPAFKFDTNNNEALNEFRELVWATVQRMNEYAPPHSRVLKEMILVCTPNKPFTYTAKNTVRRQAIIADYEDEIDALYAAIQEAAQPHISSPTEWSQTSTLSFIRIVVTEVLKREISDDEDFFASGCNSLQATKICNTIVTALEKTSPSASGYGIIPESFVHQHRSISSLASYVLSLTEASTLLGGAISSSAKTESKYGVLNA